jgi:hypothetical protein
VVNVTSASSSEYSASPIASLLSEVEPVCEVGVAWNPLGPVEFELVGMYGDGEVILSTARLMRSSFWDMASNFDSLSLILVLRYI